MLEGKDRDSWPEHSTPEEIQERIKTNNNYLEVKNVRTSKFPANGVRILPLQKFCAAEHTALLPPLLHAVICNIVILLLFYEEDKVWFPLP